MIKWWLFIDIELCEICWNLFVFIWYGIYFILLYVYILYDDDDDRFDCCIVDEMSMMIDEYIFLMLYYDYNGGFNYWW